MPAADRAPDTGRAVQDFDPEGERATARTVTAGGVRMHYHDTGGGGDPLLLLQSFGPRPGMTAWLTFHRLLPAIAARRRCLLVDLPNFGRSGPVVFDEPVHAMMARSVAALMDEVGVTAADVLGTSVGATTAVQLALDHPGRVSRLVIGSCHASTGGDPYLLAPSPTEATRLLLALADDPSREAMRRALAALVHNERLVTESLVDYVSGLAADSAEHAAAIAASRNHRHSNLAELGRITAPTLIVHGRQDRMVPLEQALLLLAYLSAADLVVLNECGHWPAFERPDDYASYVLSFLDRPPR